jgi:A/G-specific adenine glycosylase
MQSFKKTIWDYYKKQGRHDLPWRKTKDPYKIMVSEYMLQQTQVGRVIPKYLAFIKRFPTFKSLANAKIPEVLKLWQGLGYNRRALYLKQAAEIIELEYKGKLPKDQNILTKLPGIGPNTAAAILTYSFNIPITFIETNIRRIYIHFFFSKSKSVDDKKILALVAKTVDTKNPREWYWALMDYGTYLKTQIVNPNRKSKHYTKQSKFKGSDREIRGKILRIILKDNSVRKTKLTTELHEEKERVNRVLKTLVKDGFIKESGGKIVLIK